MSVGDAMVRGQGSCHHGTGSDLAADGPWPVDDFSESDQRNLWRIDDAEYSFHALVAETGDCNGGI